ncbi:VCBS repeat-containing protein [Grimontia sp. S25]|uniref:VCBS repeat-containing protein n=1 Tax=Grimontia sedimenti TaxID=2711294 RepID=A0A6M1RJ04_9GAMM|nr:VCBS repeat-containing protein [Grimontia sedimenti]NGO00135.1 VCBS repeat-containing protein [Grimontia sedimenti]
MKKTLISTLVASVLLSGCGSDDNQVTSNATPLDVQTTFSARYIQTLPGKNQQAAAYIAPVEDAQYAAQKTQVRYLGQLEVTNVDTGAEQVFDWPVTQTVDADGNVTTTSHRALTLKPGTYDFALLLTTEGANPKQYLAKALGHEVLEGEQPAIEFVVEPNLGDTITNFDEIDYVSKLAFQWKAEELAGLNKPQFGLSVNGGDEQVFEINKETGLAEITMNVEPGEYTLSLRLYDGDLMVGQNEEDSTVNFVEGENAQTDIVPIQADVVFEVDEIKDRGTFAFNVPDVLIEEVGGLENLTLKATITAGGIEAQERVLDILDVNGSHIAKDMFETGGADKVGVYLAFYDTQHSQDLAELTPFTSCTTDVTVEANQTLGCKVALKRESIITNRILGTLRINAVNENWTPAEGADVLLNGEKIGVTGSEIGAGTFKTHLVAGEYQVEVRSGVSTAQDTLSIAPLSVENIPLTLVRNSEVGAGTFVELHTYRPENFFDHGATGDLNGDGNIDLALALEDNRVQIFYGDGSGVFPTSSLIDVAYPSTRIKIVDINGDGKNDLLMSASFKAENGGLMIYENKGDNQYTLRQTLEALAQSYVDQQSLEAVDINNDGNLEILASTSRTHFGIFKLNADNHFELNSTYSTDTARAIAVGDVNNDGYVDIWADSLLVNDGNGNFTFKNISLGSANIATVQFADFNGDEHLDLLATDWYDGETIVFTNDGFANFNTSHTVSTHNPDRNLPAVGDIDLDGHQDIVMMNRALDPTTGREKAALYRYIGNKHTDFTEHKIQSTTYPDKMLLADIDNDGDLDLIGLGFKVSVFKNTPTH